VKLDNLDIRPEIAKRFRYRRRGVFANPGDIYEQAVVKTVAGLFRGNPARLFGMLCDLYQPLMNVDSEPATKLEGTRGHILNHKLFRDRFDRAPELAVRLQSAFDSAAGKSLP
jgi:hypothetical protein